MDMEQKIRKTLQGLSIEFLSIIYVIWKILVYILKNREFLQNFKNRAGEKLKLPKRESPAGIGRVGMSGNN